MIDITMYRLPMDRLVVNRFVVDKSVIILVLTVDDSLKSLIIAMRSRVMRARFFMEIRSLFVDRFLFIGGSLFVCGLLLSRFRRSFIAISMRLMSIIVLVRMLVASVVVLWLPVVNWLSVVPAFLFVVVIVAVVGFGSIGSGFAFLL